MNITNYPTPTIIHAFNTSTITTENIELLYTAIREKYPDIIGPSSTVTPVATVGLYFNYFPTTLLLANYWIFSSLALRIYVFFEPVASNGHKK